MRTGSPFRRSIPAHLTTAGCVAALALCACADDPPAPAPQTEAAAAAPDEMGWARAALERHPGLQLLATDTGAGVFTVRDRESGEVRVVALDELAAVPVALLSAPPASMPAPAEPASAPVTAPAPAAAGTGDVADAEPAFDYTVEREGGQLRVTGPGISIVSAGTPGPETARGEPGQQVIDPIICEGRRVLQVDNRRIFVNGDAITARDGCELHITNSRIVASGTGIVVRDAAVHVTNSYVEGAAAAYDAGPGARLYLRRATLNGTMRRDLSAEIKELQAGEWR